MTDISQPIPPDVTNGNPDTSRAAIAHLIHERDQARTERDTHHANLGRIRVILHHAAGNDEDSSPLRTSGVVEAVAWLVDDWRIERSANAIEREAENTIKTEFATLRTELATVTKARDELAEALTNPRRTALQAALRLAPRPGPLTGPSTADVLTIADWLLTKDHTEQQATVTKTDHIPDADTFDTRP